MKPRRLDSETIVSRLATDGPGTSAGGVGLAVTQCLLGTGLSNDRSGAAAILACRERGRPSLRRQSFPCRGRSHPSTIAGLPARQLIANGRSSPGHQRHGIVGMIVTGDGRYRVEMWANPGT